MHAITDRDAKLFLTLSAFNLLSTRQIKQLFFQGISSTTVCRRLRILQKKGMFHRLAGLPDGGLMWAISKTCAQRYGLGNPLLRINRNALEHDICLNDVRIRLTKASIGHQWVAEHEIRRETSKERNNRKASPRIIPDALITLKIGGTLRTVALELEINMKSRRRYKEIFSKHGKSDAIELIWYLVPNVGMGKRLEALWLNEPSYRRKPDFIWSLYPEIIANLGGARIYQQDRVHLLTEVLTP
jgi:hypothetical protein